MNRMPFPSKKQSLELAAQFIESDLHAMRERARQQYETAIDRGRVPCPQGCRPGNAIDPESEGVPSPCRVCKGEAYINNFDGREYPLGSSLEGDLMKAVEWAWSAATLRAMAEQEG